MKKIRKKIEDYIKGDNSIRLYNVKDQIALGDELRERIYLLCLPTMKA